MTALAGRHRAASLPPMSSFSLANPLEMIKQLTEGPLSEAATGLKLASASLGAPVDAGIPGVSITAKMGASLSVFAYGGKSKNDPEGVVGHPLPPGRALDALRVPPPLPLEGKVYLAYRMDTSAKASGGGGLGFFGASAQTERRLRLSDYRAHDPAQLLRDAVLADSARLCSLLRSDDVAAIRQGDALALATTGRMAASLSVSWSDVIPGVLGRLSGLLPGADHLVAIETNLGASVHAEASMEDDFALVFSRPEPGKLRATVLRCETCAAGVGGGLSVNVAFDPSAPIEAVLGGLLGRPLKWVDDTIAKAVQVPLDDATRNALAFALNRVGLAGGEADPPGLLARWEALKGLLRGKLRNLVTLRLTAGLTYDFTRTEQKQALFQAVFPDGEALEHHGALLGGNLAAVLGALRAKGRAPEIYLRQHSVERKRAWGFSLGVPFFGSVASSTDEDRLRFVTNTRQDGQRRLAALGARSYRGDLFGSSAEWGAELDAEMAGFSAAPKAKDFQYGLHLLLHREGKSLGAGALAQLVDDAVVWGAVSESDRARVLEQVTARAGNGRVDARVELTIQDDGLRALLQAAPAAGRPLVARALGRSMPWYGWRVRQNADVRGAAYLPLWEGLLRDNGWSPQAAAATAAKTLAQNPIASDIAASEGQWPTPGLVTFASLVNAYPTVAASSQRMLAGLQALASTIDSELAADAIEAAFQQLRDGWAQSFLLKAFGAMVLALATQRGVAKLVERTFTVALPDADAQLAFTTSK